MTWFSGVSASQANRLRSVWCVARYALLQRYCGSLLGFTWSLLNPLAMLGVYLLVFSVFIRVPIENYFGYMSSGLLPWLYLSNTLNAATQSLTSRAQILNCSTIDRLILILADAKVELVSFGVAMGIFLALNIIFVGDISWAWLALPFLALPLIIAATSGAVVLAYCAARYRDISHLLQIGLTVNFWLLPIVYHWSMVPKPFDLFIRYSPLALLITPIQIAIHGHTIPSLALMTAATSIAALMAGWAVYIYRRMDRTIIFYV